MGGLPSQGPADGSRADREPVRISGYEEWTLGPEGRIVESKGHFDEAEYPGDRAVRPGDSLHLFLLRVADRVAGRGVAQQLVAACLEHGLRRGYQVAVTEATNNVSQRIFRKQGFVERAQRSYQTHRFGARAVFASIAEHGGPMLMDRSLTQ